MRDALWAVVVLSLIAIGVAIEEGRGTGNGPASVRDRDVLVGDRQ